MGRWIDERMDEKESISRGEQLSINAHQEEILAISCQ